GPGLGRGAGDRLGLDVREQRIGQVPGAFTAVVPPPIQADQLDRTLGNEWVYVARGELVHAAVRLGERVRRDAHDGCRRQIDGDDVEDGFLTRRNAPVSLDAREGQRG